MPSVAIVGASTNPDRPSHQAVVGYLARGYRVWPVHPAGGEIAGATVYRDLASLPSAPDIITMYVNARTGAEMLDAIVAAKPRVLWLNPGADGEPIVSLARARGLTVVEACNLVALGRGDPLVVAGVGE